MHRARPSPSRTRAHWPWCTALFFSISPHAAPGHGASTAGRDRVDGPVRPSSGRGWGGRDRIVDAQVFALFAADLFVTPERIARRLHSQDRFPARPAERVGEQPRRVLEHETGIVP